MKTKNIILIVCFTIFFYIPGMTLGEVLTGEEILQKIDNNYTTKGSISTNTMIIQGRRGSRTITFKQWAEGNENAFTHFLSPPREKDTKMLKRSDELWIYTPSSDRMIKIAGHMLRQSLMGSDASYEDVMEDHELSHYYDVKVIGTETFTSRECYVLELTAIPGKKVQYYARKMWVDTERFLPLKEELFAKSGKPLKKFLIQEVVRINDQWYPKQITFKDVLKQGEGTKLIIDTIQLDVAIPRHIFSKAALRK